MRPKETGAAPDDSLGNLVAEVLERIEREGTRALEEACNERPALADALRKRVLSLRELGLVDAISREHMPGKLGDFQLVERIGAGGMGVVYHAIQVSLGRDVALKLIRPDLLLLPGARERFARETTIIARLQHPGIVPIYTVGSSDELPYYAMERVPGCTLAEALAALDRESPRELTGADLARAVRKATPNASGGGEAESSLFAGSWEQVALRIVRHVAEALEHAHSRGVLHRDLKPSNVMITLGGRVMLVDFGLSHSAGSDTVTRSGERAGSLPYMPPELLESGLRAVDQRSDIYSLGVTLYQLLTLQLPFAADNEMVALASILEGRPRRPRALVRGISWEAETVCLVAMERDPGRRYATATDLARDLGQVLEHRPVEARRASPWLRTRRWIERRPGAAAAIALALIAPTVIAVQQVNKAQRIGEALSTVRAKETLAEANFERSLHAVDSMLRRVGSESLDHVPGTDGMREELLGEAMTLYSELEREHPDDATLASRGAQCALLRARLLARAANDAEAVAILRELLDRLETWRGRDTYEIRLSRAKVLTALANDVADADESAALRNAGLQVYGELRRERPGDLDVLELIATSMSDAIIDARQRGERDGGLGVLDTAEHLAREIYSANESPKVKALLAMVLAHRGYLFSLEGSQDDVRRTFEEVLALRRSALEERPDDETLREGVAEAASSLASSLVHLDRNAEALECLDLAACEIERSRADFPEVMQFAYRSADVALNRGAALGRLKRTAESREALQHAALLLGWMLERDPRDARTHQTLGTTLLNLAASETSLGDPNEALAICARSRARFEAAIALTPNDPDIRPWLALERAQRASVLLKLDRIADAAEALPEAQQLAGHRTEHASHCLLRLCTVIERARASGDEEILRRSKAAGQRALALAHERGDLEADARLKKLTQLVAD
jgi:serine/threonine protein kinase